MFSELEYFIKKLKGVVEYGMSADNSGKEVVYMTASCKGTTLTFYLCENKTEMGCIDKLVKFLWEVGKITGKEFDGYLKKRESYENIKKSCPPPPFEHNPFSAKGI